MHPVWVGGGMADAADLRYLSTRVGNILCEFCQIRGILSTLVVATPSQASYCSWYNTLVAKSKKYTDQELAQAVKISYSIRAVLDKLGLAPTGGSCESIQKVIKEFDLDTSHFLGQAILKGKAIITQRVLQKMF